MEGAPKLQQLGKTGPQAALSHPRVRGIPEVLREEGWARFLLQHRKGQVFQLALSREQLLQLCPRVCREVDF